jgi:Rrf2 family protein
MEDREIGINSQFAISVHILVLLASTPYEPITSDRIAASVKTHPAFIRRIMGKLRRAGLVSAQPGADGGWRLLRDAAKITLCDIYEGIEKDPLFALHRRSPQASGPVGQSIHPILEETTQEAENTLKHHLAQTSIAAVLNRLHLPS